MPTENKMQDSVLQAQPAESPIPRDAESIRPGERNVDIMNPITDKRESNTTSGVFMDRDGKSMAPGANEGDAASEKMPEDKMELDKTDVLMRKTAESMADAAKATIDGSMNQSFNNSINTDTNEPPRNVLPRYFGNSETNVNNNNVQAEDLKPSERESNTTSGVFINVEGKQVNERSDSKDQRAGQQLEQQRQSSSSGDSAKFSSENREMMNNDRSLGSEYASNIETKKRIYCGEGGDSEKMGSGGIEATMSDNLKPATDSGESTEVKQFFNELDKKAEPFRQDDSLRRTGAGRQGNIDHVPYATEKTPTERRVEAGGAATKVATATTDTNISGSVSAETKQSTPPEDVATK